MEDPSHWDRLTAALYQARGTRTYNGYALHGGFEAVAAVANGARERWEVQSVLPTSLGDARCALFFEHRRWRHFGYEPAGRDEEYIRALVEQVRDLSDGMVEVEDSST